MVYLCEALWAPFEPFWNHALNSNLFFSLNLYISVFICQKGLHHNLRGVIFMCTGFCCSSIINKDEHHHQDILPLQECPLVLWLSCFNAVTQTAVVFMLLCVSSLKKRSHSSWIFKSVFLNFWYFSHGLGKPEKQCNLANAIFVNGLSFWLWTLIWDKKIVDFWGQRE